MIDYQAKTEELLIYLIEHDARKEPEPLVRVHIKLQDFIKLDNGSAYLGFCQETANLANVSLIENWTYESNVKAN